MGVQSEETNDKSQHPFPDIGDPEAEREAEEQAGGEERTQDSDLAQRLERLEAERKEEREAAQERERRMQATIERMAQSQPAAAGETRQQEEEEIELPDPVNDPKGYNAAVQKLIDQRAQRHAREITQQSTSQQSAQQRMNDLWTRFQEKHKDLAQHDLVISGVAQREMARLREAGVDPMQYAATDPDGFVDKIASESKRYLTERGIPLEGGKEGERPDPQGRTAGIDGGGPQRGAKGGGGGEKGTSFVDDLKKAQVESGFF